MVVEVRRGFGFLFETRDFFIHNCLWKNLDPAFQSLPINYKLTVSHW